MAEERKGKFVMKDLGECPVAQTMSQHYSATKGKEKAKGYTRAASSLPNRCQTAGRNAAGMRPAKWRSGAC